MLYVAGMDEDVRLSLQDQLVDVIMRVLCARPQLHYYQVSFRPLFEQLQNKKKLILEMNVFVYLYRAIMTLS